MKKRLLAVALSALLVLSYSACGSKIAERSTDRSSYSSEQSKDRKKSTTSKRSQKNRKKSSAEDSDSYYEDGDSYKFSDYSGNYNADGDSDSEIDFSDDPDAEMDDGLMTLEDIIDSDEMQDTLAEMNEQAAGSGITIDIVAEGNTFVYEYWLPDEDVYNSLSYDEAEEIFEPTVEAYTSSVQDLFTNFEEEFNIILDSVRFTFYTADSGVLYTVDIPNQ